MASKKQSQEEAKRIYQLRESGLTDAQIAARHGSDKLAEGYRWIEANPGVDPRGETTTAAARPSRGAGPRLKPEPALPAL